MPFSAHSPDGPVSLLGADAVTVENLRSRNRREACFTAKCCGAPLIIRTVPGKAPHFVHKTVPQGCDADRRETWEHERLKLLIATSVRTTGQWSVETEAIHRDPRSQQLLWRADVLACRRRAAVAFEVQLSNADYDHMRQRQDRYRQSGVRGLWFVRTKKEFPPGKELPIFVVESESHGDRVRLLTAGDYPFIVGANEQAESMALNAFVRCALQGRLQWAPFGGAPETWLDAFVDYAPGNACPGCGRIEADPFLVRARIARVTTYPEFQFAKGFSMFRKTSGWYEPLLNAVWSRVADQANVALRTPQGTCARCSTQLGNAIRYAGGKTQTLATPLQLKDLPKPRYGSVERSWLYRWAAVQD